MEDDLGPPPRKRAKYEMLTPRLAAALDKCKVSEADAVHLSAAFLEAVSLNISDYIINRTSIRKKRAMYREERRSELKEKFCKLNTSSITIHWDTKLLENVSGKKEDRLAVIGTGLNIEQLLGVPIVSSGTGFNISSAVFDILEEWSLIDKVQAFVFDTTASNTGKYNGATRLLQNKIGRDILFLGCRHHIFEIILGAIFNKCKITPMSGPDIQLFKRFKNEWSKLDKENFVHGLVDTEFKELLGETYNEIQNLVSKMILEEFPRDDYREFLELVIIVLGGVPPKGVKFRKPGAYHRARWMAKGIYTLKIFLFRNQFNLTKKESRSIAEINAFIVKCYVVHWFSAPVSHHAALNDIIFIRTLYNYKIINNDLAEEALRKFINHLYYLNVETSAFALFDERVSSETKCAMIKRIFSEELPADDVNEKKIQKKLILKYDDIQQFLKDDDETILCKLVCQSSKNMFKRFNLSDEFIKIHPNSWNNQSEYKEAEAVIKNIKVVNDAAERGIKLIEEFNTSITYDEDQKQYLMQVSSLLA